MDWYGLMINHLPPIYKTADTMKRYKIIAQQLWFIDELLDGLKTCGVIDLANEEDLMVLGSNLDVVRDYNDDLDTYRKMVKIEYYKTFIIPTHDNIKNIVQKVTGFYPSLRPLWEKGIEQINDHGYTLEYEIDLPYPQKILDSAESVVGAGIKIDRTYLTKLEGHDYLHGQALLNHDHIIIGGE